jgi:hypothetical protein
MQKGDWINNVLIDSAAWFNLLKPSGYFTYHQV